MHQEPPFTFCGLRVRLKPELPEGLVVRLEGGMSQWQGSLH